MNIINIRPIEKEDNRDLAEIIKSCFDDFNVINREGTVFTDPTTNDLFSLFQKPLSALFVAEDVTGILGCCGIFPTENLPENCGELVKFYLSSKSRGKGIGKLLMEKVVKEAKKLGYTSIYLESLPEFSTAVSIYEKQGFQYLEQPLGDSGHTGCNLWMLKNI